MNEMGRVRVVCVSSLLLYCVLDWAGQKQSTDNVGCSHRHRWPIGSALGGSHLHTPLMVGTKQCRDPTEADTRVIHDRQAWET